MACPLDCGNEHALVLGAGSGDAFWNDPTLFRNEALELLFGLVIHKVFLVVAEPAGAFLANLSG